MEQNLVIRVTWTTVKGVQGDERWELDPLIASTIDSKDIKYAVDNVIKELRRLQDSRQFTPEGRQQ